MSSCVCNGSRGVRSTSQGVYRSLGAEAGHSNRDYEVISILEGGEQGIAVEMR